MSESRHPPTALDAETLAGLFDVGDEAFVDELFDLYLDRADQGLETIHTAACAEDLHTLSEAANDLKGSSATVGALRLAEFCDQLEQLEASQLPTGAADLIEQIARQFERIEAQMRSWQRSNISQID